MSWTLGTGFPDLTGLFFFIHSAKWEFPFIKLQKMWSEECEGFLLTLRLVGRIRNWSVKLERRDFYLGTVDSIIGTCQPDFPWILKPHVPRLPKAVSLPHDLLVKGLRHRLPTLSDGGDSDRWPIWRTECQENHWGEQKWKHVQHRWYIWYIFFNSFD